MAVCPCECPWLPFSAEILGIPPPPRSSRIIRLRRFFQQNIEPVGVVGKIQKTWELRLSAMEIAFRLGTESGSVAAMSQWVSCPESGAVLNGAPDPRFGMTSQRALAVSAFRSAG